MNNSVLSGILKVDQETKKAFLSIDATLQKIYKIEADKNKREIKERKEDQQEKKTKEKERNVLEDILGELKKDKKGGLEKKNNLFDILKKGLSFISEGLGSIFGGKGLMTKLIAGALGGKFLESVLSPVFKTLFKVGGPIFGVVTAALVGWKIGEWLNKNVVETHVKPWLGQVDNAIRNKVDRLGGGGQAGGIRSVDVRRLIEEKQKLLAPVIGPNLSGIPELSPVAKRQTQLDLVALEEIDKLIHERQKLNDQLYTSNQDLTRMTDPISRNEHVKKIQDLKDQMKEKENRIDELVKERRLEQLQPQGKQRGGTITVPGSGSGDKVPMMLPPGSFVLNRNAAGMLQNGGLVPTLLEPGEKVISPGDVSPLHHMLNTMIPRFQEGGEVKDTYGKQSEEGLLPPQAKTTQDELKLTKLLEKFSGKAMGGEIQPNQKRGIYIEGGREGYDPHFHINRADQANYNRTALDPYVKVNGKPLSSGLTVNPGGQWGASRDGGKRRHTGIDFAFGGGTQLSLTDQAEWLSNQAVSGIGDKTSFKTPVGVFEVIHGTYKGNALPGSYDGSNIASSPGAESKPQNALDSLIGAASGLGIVGEAIGGMMGALKDIAGPELINAMFGMSGSGSTPQQATVGVSGAPGNDSKMEPGKWNGLLKLIKRGEGPSGYEAMYPSTTLPGATKMTIAEVARKATGAVGAWQNLPEHLITRARAVGLDPNKDLYNEINQQKIAEYLIGPGQAGVTVAMAKSNPKEAMFRLSQVWAALPKDDSGRSYYAGDGKNSANIKPQEVYAEFSKLQHGGIVNMSATQSPNTSRFKQAQEEFAQMIADKSGSPIIINAGGGSSTPTIVRNPNIQSSIPDLPSGPSSIQAAEYFYRLNMGSVL